MDVASTTETGPPPAAGNRLPWAALLALAAAGFLAIFTETIPAGLLPRLAEGLRVSEPAAGQLVTVYAAGSVLAAIPLVALTRRLSRKGVLLGAVLGLLLFNTATALAPWYPLVLLARFLAGAAAALVWGVLAGYARRLVSPAAQGRALTVAGIGQPVALAAGVPLGALAGSLVDWRWVFAAISVAAALLALWIGAAVPDAPGMAPSTSNPLHRVLVLPGIGAVLLAMLLWVLAHNVLYTYVAPLLAPTGLRVEAGLSIFGVASFLGIAATGLVIDRALRRTALLCLAVMAGSGVVLALPVLGAVAAGLAVAVWGLSFGGAPALLQTALADRASRHTDAAQSVFVTVFNAAVAGGGLLGGWALSFSGSAAAPAGLAAIVAAAALIVVALGRRAFPAGPRGD